jgi:hypothetical protein
MGFLSGMGGTNILLQAVGAAMRGESAQDFMSRLANERPELKQINLADLQGSAQALCQQKGIDPSDLAKKIDGVVDPVIKR